jgi:hypothetical protein
MKTNKLIRRMTLTFIGIGLFQTSFCQENYLPGYIVPLSGDTLYGFIDYQNWEKNPYAISFKEKSGTIKKKYTPIDIKEFSVSDEIYESAIVKTEVSPEALNDIDKSSDLKIKIDTVFLQTMIKGPKSLYYYNNKLGKSQFYIKRDSVYELLIYKKYMGDQSDISEVKKFIGQLTYYLQDCPSINSKIENAEYQKESLEKLFLYYYNGTHSSGITFQKKTEKLRTELGVLAGLSVTSLNFTGDNNLNNLVSSKFNSSKNFAAGIFFNIIVPRNHGRLSIYNELGYTSYSVNGFFNNTTSGTDYTNTYTTIEYSYLKMSNLLRYKYPIGKLFAFINVGVSNGLVIGGSNKQKVESKYYDTKSDVEYNALGEIRNYEQGILIGLGLKCKKYSFECRYENGSGITNYQEVKSRTSRCYFLLGYRF